MVPAPCIAASSDTLIYQEGSITDWADAHIDDNLIATYVSSSSPPAIGAYHADGIFYKSIPLTNETCTVEALGISGGRVYYSETDNEIPWTVRRAIVYEHTLDTGKKRALYTTPSFSDIVADTADQILKNGGHVDTEQVTKIVADGDHVVLRGGSGDRKLILLTLSTGSSKVIFTSHDWIHGLAIDGDRILWGCERVDREPGREIHIYTISTNEDFVIPESKSIRTFGYGDMSGDNVAWVMGAKEPDYINGVPVTGESYDIRLTDLISGKTRSIETSETAPIVAPFISGNTIAWVKKPNVDYNNSDTGTIRVYDIGTGEFRDAGSEVASISDFDNGLVLWHRLKPMSFRVTRVSDKTPATGSPTASTTETGTPGSAMQPTPVPESSVDPAIIVSALTAGITGYVVFNKRR